MKLLGVTSRPNRRRQQTLAGQILTEAAIGLFLLVFVWLLVSYVNYMSDKRIRTNMAGRYSAWLSGNGVNPTANNGSIIATNFFMGNDSNLVVQASPVKNSLTLFGFSLPTSVSSFLALPTVWSNSVAFGITPGQVSGTTKFPFNLMNVHVPFMPSTLLTNFTMVRSHAAWPGDISDTYSSGTVQAAVYGIGYGLPVLGIPE